MRPVLVPQTALGKRCLWLVLLAILIGISFSIGVVMIIIGAALGIGA